jgi:hypothetical protein
VPIGLAAAASASFGASERSFWPVRHRDSLLTKGGGINTTFTAAGAGLRVAQGTLGLSLAAVGHGQRVERVSAVAPEGAANQVLYRHSLVTEFYRNGPYGLEQGFTVRQRSHEGEGSFVLALSVRGSLIPQQVGSQILFRSRAGTTALRYGQLTALDAAGHRLPAHIQLRNGSLELRIDDSHARYPLRIDPFLQQGAKLTASGGGHFGASVALSSDGNTALIGAYTNNSVLGAAFVFTRSGSTWTEQAKLTGAGEVGKGFFGGSVALSSDGNTALIGASADNEGVGAAWVFTRSGSTWTQQGSKLIGSGASKGSDFGASVALSSDGNTALIGGPEGGGKPSETGAAWVFTRSGSTWTEQAKLTGSGEVAGCCGILFGGSVALSSDGNTALVSGWSDNSGHGAVWVFTRSGSTWSQQGSKLTGGGESLSNGEFGYSVALSSDGNTALIGGEALFAHKNFAGAAWVFTRSGSTWTQQGEKLTGSGESGEGLFGQSVALSSDGNIALIGAPDDNVGIGAAWVFARSGSTWAQQGSKLTGSGEVGEGRFGWSVALSSEGNTAAIGGSYDNTQAGAAWVFVGSPTVVTQAASAVTPSTATLNATVNPHGSEVTDCKLEYGTTTAYGSTAPCTPSPGSASTPVAVSASVTGLSANTRYHFRVSATNAGGTSKGADETLKTLHTPPFVETKAASSVMQTSATLNGTVKNAGSGGELLLCEFEYGTTTSYGSSVAATPCPSGEPEPGPGENIPVSASIAGLAPNTTYHFRVSATNLGGTSKGLDQSFTTLPASHWYGNGVPVGSEPVTVISWGTITLKTVVGGSGEVTCHTVAAGTVRNPEPFGTTLGVGSTQVWASFHCESTTCPFTSVVTAGSLPWASAVEREGTSMRIKTTALSVRIDCQKEGKSEGSETFVGAVAPSAKHGTSSLHPGSVEYDAGAGSLEKEASKGGVLGKLEGEVKVLGYNEQELINVN